MFKPQMDIEQSFKSYLDSIGHPLLGEMEFDTDSWSRYSCPHSSKSNNTNVAYMAHTDKTPVIKVQCHKCHPSALSFIYKDSNILKSTEWKKLQEKKHRQSEIRSTEKANKRSQKLIYARELYNNSQPCLEHDYLKKKCVTVSAVDGLKIRQSDGAILNPINLIHGHLISIQTISKDGQKKFMKDTSPKCGFHTLGKQDSDLFILCESIGTGLTIKEALNHSVVCTYGKSNFLPVAKAIKSKYKNAVFNFICDKDKDHGSQKQAEKAISETGGKFVLPDFSETPDDINMDIEKSDFNDLFVLLMKSGESRAAALDQVRQQITLNLREPIMTESIDNKIPIKSSNDENLKASEALLQIIDEGNYKFFHNEHQESYCKYESQKPGIYETRRIADRNFRNYLSFIYRSHEGKTIGENSLKEVIAELEGRSLYDKSSKKETVFLRVAESNGRIYLDLCNEEWRAIEISCDGWKVLDSKDLPVYFERSLHAKQLPDPETVTHGDISKLWELINIPEDYQILVLAYILDSYRCNTAFPILVLLGLQDSGKSSTQHVIRSLIDPSASNLRTSPRKADDLVTEAASNYLISYNNVSRISNEMHDDFCCISTGSGFSTRKFFTNLEQIVVNIARPVALNGIYNFIHRPDMLDRSIILELDSIKEEKRKTDSELSISIKQNLPLIFRGLIDLMVKVMQNLPNVSLKKMPRMADYALLGIATEKALDLSDGSFMESYLGNRNHAKEDILEASPVMLALVDFIEEKPDKFWRGRLSDLLTELTKLHSPSSNLTWPNNAKGMSAELRRFTAALKQYDIEVIDERKLSGTRKSKGNYFRISKLSTQHTLSTPHKADPIIDEASTSFDEVHIDDHQLNTSSHVHTNVHTTLDPLNPYSNSTSEVFSEHSVRSAHLNPTPVNNTKSINDGDGSIFI